MRRARIARPGAMGGVLSGRHRSKDAGNPRVRARGIHRLRRRQADPREAAPKVQSGPFWCYIAVVTGAGALVLLSAAVSGFRHHLRFDGSYVCVVILLRLVLDWFLTSVVILLTLGLRRELRDKWAVYGRLLVWHLRGCP